MAELTTLDEKLAEVIGLAMASQGATTKVKSLVKDKALAKQLDQMGKEAAEAEKRAAEVAAGLDGKKGAIMKEARAVKKKATEMMKDYLERGSDALDGFEFLTMAEAGEVGHWTVLQELNKKAGNKQIRELVRWQLPIQKQHLKNAQTALVQLAGQEDPNETS
ncbi:MAG TPA: hypothetical protein VM290_03750 [Gaiellaceae bacterium]|jgi:replicative DNA helicase|nr:hypothetical protein [Gaiellaceae bacterium]